MAGTGGFGILDEFNRIDVQVLSTFSGMLKSLQNSLRTGSDTFEMFGQQFPCKQSVSVNLTMNPGYAGRTELPDSCKARFRSCAMMVPDYMMIAEVTLFARGFTQAKEWARKIVTVFKNCSEQLSSQDHYDYGMRAVKGSISIAGDLRVKYPESSEAQLIHFTLNELMGSIFTKADKALFKGIMSDQFPGLSEEDPFDENVRKAIQEAIKNLGLVNTPYLEDQALSLYRNFSIKAGVIMLGPTCTGKTTVIKVLQTALDSIDGKTHLVTIFPKSITG